MIDRFFPDELLLRLDFRDPDPAVIDISPEGGVVSSLKEGIPPDILEVGFQLPCAKIVPTLVE